MFVTPQLSNDMFVYNNKHSSLGEKGKRNNVSP